MYVLSNGYPKKGDGIKEAKKQLEPFEPLPKRRRFTMGETIQNTGANDVTVKR